MTIRPDPTFHASPKLAMEAPPENFAYTLLLSPDFSKPDALAVIDVKPGSPTFSQVVHTVTMPNKGDEFHHFGWNACSSALSPLTGHAFLERRYLIIPGIRSSRIYIVDTKPDPTKAKIHKIIEPEEVFKKTGYSRPHTVHCGPEVIYVSTLGGGGKDGTDRPPGVFLMDCETFAILGRWDIDRGPQTLPMISGEPAARHGDRWWAAAVRTGSSDDLLANKYGHQSISGSSGPAMSTIDLGANPRWRSGGPRTIPYASTGSWASFDTRISKVPSGPGGAKEASSTSRRRRRFRPSRRPRTSCHPSCRGLAQCRRW